MKIIDVSQGEGGWQILRSALALSMCTQTPIRINNIRAGSIVEQTAAAMNRGETPDEIVEHVKLPAELAERPYLQGFYGTVAWSARAYFAGTVGWFDGNPTNLFPTPPVAKASKLAKMAGGEGKVYANLLSAQEEGDHQWASELADILLALDYQTEQVKYRKAESLEVLADDQINATARNYYLVYAKELRGEI